MKLRRLWLAVTVILFVGWLGWLGYVAATASHPIVLSRPQLMMSTLDVIADVPGAKDRPGNRAIVRQVHWPASQGNLVGKAIEIVNLPQAKHWTGPGSYILCLVSDGNGKYQVAAIPSSPGYEGWGQAPRIYPATTETLQQLDSIPKRSVEDR
jgi:hypothetical protein